MEAIQEARAHADANPLRQWRKNNSASMNEVCLLLDIGTTALQKLESGVKVPDAELLAKMALLMNQPLTGVKGEWGKWTNSKPRL